MCLQFTCLLPSYLGVFTKFKVKSRCILSSVFFFGSIEHNLQNKHNYRHNFRNTRALLEAYYATFASTSIKAYCRGTKNI